MGKGLGKKRDNPVDQSPCLSLEMGEKLKTEGIYVYQWLIHVEFSQKTAKFCKAIILQLKTKQKHYLVWALFGNLKY